jgi:hypothetical protein
MYRQTEPTTTLEIKTRKQKNTVLPLPPEKCEQSITILLLIKTRKSKQLRDAKK